MTGRTVIVCGGRDFDDYDRLAEFLDAEHGRDPISSLKHGDARGADRLAARWAESRQIPDWAFSADWEHDGRAAGPIRNQRMLDSASGVDAIIAFPGGRGTDDMVRRALKAGVVVIFALRTESP